MKNPNPNYVPPATVGCETPEFRRMTKAPAPKPTKSATEYITISVAEYHCLTKAAAMLEVICNDTTYDHTTVVNAVKETVIAMRRTAEAGAEE